MSEKADWYKEAANKYMAATQRLLDEVDGLKQIKGPNQGKLNNLSGLLAGQLRKLGAIESCLISLHGVETPAMKPCAPPLTEPPLTQKSNTKNPNKKRREKKYGKHVKPKDHKVPTNRRKQKVRQDRNKRKQVRQEATDGCTGKKQFTKDEAIEAGSRMLEQHKDLNKMAVYWCTKCGNHHLTKEVTRNSKRNNTQVAVLEKVYDYDQAPT